MIKIAILSPAKKILPQILFLLILIVLSNKLFSQNYFPSDPYETLIYENKQFNGDLEMSANLFKPYFFNNNDSLDISINFLSQAYLNNNSPNQENMDVRYFSKGYSIFNSLRFSMNSKFFKIIFEPYLKYDKFYSVEKLDRGWGGFNRLNDNPLPTHMVNKSMIRNLLLFVHYKGIGFGHMKGNRWWGPGIHSSLQMTNNTWPIGSTIIGTLRELRFGNFGFMALYSFSNLKNDNNPIKKYFTSLNGKITWYGPIILSGGFSRNYLSGGQLSNNGRIWKAADAQLLVFEGFLTSNLLKYEYTVGGHDVWDQTISGYVSLILPKRNLKLYAEIGANDNRMYLADLISQPDHTMATILGFRDYGFGLYENMVYGFEWTNMMISYTIRHRGSNGAPAWYERALYDFSSYNSRRWGAHSGSDSDDWLIYAGYLSDNFMFIPFLNYERHGIVTNRPAEVKIELKLDIRYNLKGMWFGIFFESQREMFLGFPNYFYEDKFGNAIDSPSGKLAKSRSTQTIYFTLNKNINF